MVARHKFWEKFPKRPFEAASTIYKKFIWTSSVSDENKKDKIVF